MARQARGMGAKSSAESTAGQAAESSEPAWVQRFQSQREQPRQTTHSTPHETDISAAAAAAAAERARVGVLLAPDRRTDRFLFASRGCVFSFLKVEYRTFNDSRLFS